MRRIALTGFSEGVKTSVESLAANLIELIGAMYSDGRNLIAIAEFSDHRYVQFFVAADGTVVGEVLSNLNIGEAIALSPDEEEQLREIGFHEPALDADPNWWYEARNNSEFTRLIGMVNLAVYHVLKERPENMVTLRTWAMPFTAVPASLARASNRIYLEKRHS